MSGKQVCYNVSLGQMGLSLSLDLLFVLLKGIFMKVSCWGKENKKIAKCYFQDKCVSLQKLTGFPTVATHRGSSIW